MDSEFLCEGCSKREVRENFPISGIRVKVRIPGVLLRSKVQRLGPEEKGLHMAEDMKIQINKFDGSNFNFWKMQIEDVLYQKDLYLHLGRVERKPEKMIDED